MPMLYLPFQACTISVLTEPWVGLQCENVAFPGHAHSLFAVGYAHCIIHMLFTQRSCYQQ